MSDRGEVLLLLLWLGASLIAAVVLMVVLTVRQPPDPDSFWRTVRRYFALACLICTPLPALLLLGKVSLFAYDTAGHLWWVPLVVAPFAAGGWLLWRWERPAPVEPAVLETPQPPPEPVEMWSLVGEDRHGSLPR